MAITASHLSAPAPLLPPLPDSETTPNTSRRDDRHSAFLQPKKERHHG